jgi:glucoside 3-dehydrogenase (cytochrome c) catalytic subunit
VTDANTFDAIVIGSGITGGWAAKALTEGGLKVLLLERGRNIEHRSGYKNEMRAPWELPFHGRGNADLWNQRYPIQQHSGHMDEWNQDHWVDDIDNPYVSVHSPGFRWYRGYQLGGRSLTWGRQCYRWSDVDFSANARDGLATDWPIRYVDIAPWYDRVEEFIGVSGASEGLAQLPDGRFQPAMALNVVESHVRDSIRKHFPDRRLTIGRTANLTEPKPDQGRVQCQNRAICSRGCSFGAYFSTQSSTLPAAQATGNLTLLTDSLVETINYDAGRRRVDGVNVLNTRTRRRTRYSARVVFLCAGAFNSVALLLRSASETFPTGLANSSGVLGRYIMDHANTVGAVAVMPGFESHYYYGNRPTGVVIPRFRNLDSGTVPFARGYSFQGGAYRAGWTRGLRQPGLGKDFKRSLRGPGDWKFVLTSFGECLPRKENRLSLDPVKTDADGLPQLRIEFSFGDNERKLLADAKKEAAAMLTAAGGKVVFGSDAPNPGGSAIHEMGGARMGRDPATSVLNRFNQAHDVANLFVTDGAAMASSACQNPSLTYMALTARAADHALGLLRSKTL